MTDCAPAGTRCPVCGLTLADPPNPDAVELPDDAQPQGGGTGPYRAEPITMEVARLGGGTTG